VNEKKIPSNQEKDTERFEYCSVSFERSLGVFQKFGRYHLFEWFWKWFYNISHALEKVVLLFLVVSLKWYCL